MTLSSETLRWIVTTAVGIILMLVAAIVGAVRKSRDLEKQVERIPGFYDEFKYMQWKINERDRHLRELREEMRELRAKNGLAPPPPFENRPMQPMPVAGSADHDNAYRGPYRQ